MTKDALDLSTLRHAPQLKAESWEQTPQSNPTRVGNMNRRDNPHPPARPKPLLRGEGPASAATLSHPAPPKRFAAASRMGEGLGVGQFMEMVMVPLVPEFWEPSLDSSQAFGVDAYPGYPPARRALEAHLNSNLQPEG